MSQLSTVTFLFTDIQGSTRLREQHPVQMRPALSRHDQFLHQAIEGNNGYVFKTMGDDFCTAWAEGQLMTLEQAIEYALSDVE